MMSLEMQHGAVSHPLDLNFTHNHRLQNIMFQFKEMMAAKSNPERDPWSNRASVHP
jgi:hypothetical protein